MAKAARRLLKLICLNDPHLIEKEDLGRDRNNDDTQSRASLKHLLQKRVDVDGVSMALFQLAETPAELAKDDPLDRDILKSRDGVWMLASPSWLAVRSKRIEEEAQKSALFREAFIAQHQKQIAQKVGEIANLAAQGAAAPAVSPPASAPENPPASDAKAAKK